LGWVFLGVLGNIIIINKIKSMKQILLVFLIALQSTFVMSQEVITDTIALNDVPIIKKHKKRTVNYSITGHAAYNGIDNQTSKLVCLLNDLPKGKIKNVTFYLNTGLPNLFKKKLDINYKDVMLGIIVYEVDEKGKPGKVISENEVTFLVSEKHKGALTVDLSKLNLISGKMYFGFSVLSELSATEKNIYIRFCEDDNAKMYQYMKAYNSNEMNWYSYMKYNFKLHMKIEQ
jgi:hypothetical protein